MEGLKEYIRPKSMVPQSRPSSLMLQTGPYDVVTPLPDFTQRMSQNRLTQIPTYADRRSSFTPGHGDRKLSIISMYGDRRSSMIPPDRRPSFIPSDRTPSFTQSNREPSYISPTNGAHQMARFPDELKYEVILNYLYQRQCSSLWIDDTSGTIEGTIVRKRVGEYMCCPSGLINSPLLPAMQALNVQAAMTVSSRVISTLLAYSPRAVDIPLRQGLRIQIVRSIADLARARKHQYAAFVAEESLLVVWDDEPAHLVLRVEAIEADLLNMVWMHAQGGSDDSGSEITGSEYSKSQIEIDEESGDVVPETRPVLLYNSILCALSVCLLMTLLGLGWHNIAIEVSLLHRYISISFVAISPIIFIVTLFFCSVVISSLAQFFGPVSHLRQNSKFFSAVAPPRIQGRKLPHVTIQCPVYKEGLKSVIMPTVRSIKQAISTYELQGGSANIFVNDDGLQIISEEDRRARMGFYLDNDIGWTARPAHNSDGFIRRGKFKKASNMNYGLAISCTVEERLQRLDRSADWTQDDEDEAYNRVLKEVLKEDGRAWAAGNIRIGDYILIIDSDTRVPADCFLDACSEMELSPDVAIIQFSSGVMQVAHDFFENGITFFTNMIYTAIRFAVASGDVAPFVGHNAILRWSAVQECAFLDEDGKEQIWCETSVSEDFDMALRLQVEGYIVRMAAWAGDGFKEGVSLTIYDELTRWEKYAYGCSELVFNPVKQWLRKGPFTPLFRSFIKSGMPLGSKLNILSYIGTYYAIASAWVYTLANYVAVGLYNGYLDKWYVESWRIWLSIIFVFSIAGNLALAIQRYRLGEKSFASALGENIMWCLMFIILFGGMSVHVSQALLSHMFGIDMQWGATSKEVENSNFFKEVPKVAKKFRYSMTAAFFMIVVMIIMAKATFIPWSWNITQFVAIFPMAMLCGSSILLPIALNPGLMTFTW